ncbi:MAG: bifunctional adenosylcobinamide kinase/adenosylcobinamide-phosphate guanylyltransferase [Anaerolineales bacterium]|nr:bifunctional adenosylcobinamide kinase/adenosylcobinamide-phosphate guanylyltransferase [Anaerolineales bacterium]MCZ2120803.1 bifunctional adenosylcobinamide kinase/adenosylcobinamide-phosphate guanylyltransferase [Anaerolineales bacterium]
MGKLTFIIGGARSGKSSYAQKLAEESGKAITFIATAQAWDDEMKARIQKHREDRPAEWQTLEIQKDISAYLLQHPQQTEIYLLDCITLLANNIFMQFIEADLVDEAKAKVALENEIGELIKYIREHDEEWLVITNEVGLGLVPPYQMGRVYRDLLGWTNQRLAQEADEVLWLVAGIAVPIQQYK